MLNLISNLMGKLKHPLVLKVGTVVLGALLIHTVGHAWMWALVCSALLVGSDWILKKVLP